MEYSVHLQKMHDPYVLIDAGANGGVIDSAELIYGPIDLINSGGFESGIAPWVFWKDHAEVASPSGDAEIIYDEAYEGHSCVKITFNDSTEAFVVNVHGETDGLDNIRSRTVTYSFMAKNASTTGISFYIDADDGGDGTTYEGDALPAIATGSSWTKYTFKRTYFFDIEASYHAIGFKKASGTGSVYIDDVRMTIEDDYDWDVNGSFETNLTGWYFIDNNAVANGDTDNVATRVNTFAQAGSWSAKIDFGNDGGFGYVNNIYTILNDTVELNRVDFVFSFWAKTTMNGLHGLLILDGDYSYEGEATTPSITADNAWHEYTVRGKYIINIAQPKIIIGIKAVAGSAIGTVYLDNVRFYTEEYLSDAPSQTHIVLDPALTYAEYSGLVGSRLIFMTGNNRSYGSVITEIVNSGSTITEITLAEAMPVAPAAADRFWILANNFFRYSGTGSSNMVSVTEYIGETLSITTSADSGYDKASLELVTGVIGTALPTPNVLGWRLLILSNFGQLWEGYVDSYSIEDNVLAIEAIGYRKLLDSVRYNGYFSSDPESTTPLIVRDILSACPEIFHTEATIDRGSVVRDLQYSMGGVGPMDFLSTPVLASEALEQVLRIGYYGDDSMDEMVLQVWDNATAHLKRLKVQATMDDADWFVGANDINGNATVSIGVSRSGYGNVYYATYRGDNGEQLETSGIYNVRDVRSFGVSEKMISTGSLQEGEIHLAMEVQTQTKEPTSSIGDISLTGKVGRTSGSYNLPSYLIRGGDVIYIADAMRIATVNYTGEEATRIMVAGEVTSDLIKGTTRITPRDHADRVETLASQLEINIGYE
jgi:hypothetical protein